MARESDRDSNMPRTLETGTGIFRHAAAGDVPYERYVATMAVSDLVHGPAVKELCGACPRFGMNFACPPFSPQFDEFAAGRREARVIMIRVPMACSDLAVPDDRYHAVFALAGEVLGSELAASREAGAVVAGSGRCSVCSRCAAESGGERCTRPAERIYSLESLGVNVVDLAGRCFDIDLQWSGAGGDADFVCAVGAVFR